MDFIFMLTRDDRTVAECLRAAEAAISLGIEHVGFKDVGARPAVLRELVQRIKEAGATSYLEIVGLAPDATRRAVDLALELQIDCLLGGGGDLRTLASLVAGSGIAYYPFAGRPQGHPTVLDGTPADIAADCALADELGCAGVDLLAYRATTTDPLALVRHARAALQGRLVVAGSIASPTQIAALAAPASTPSRSARRSSPAGLRPTGQDWAINSPRWSRPALRAPVNPPRNRSAVRRHNCPALRGQARGGRTAGRIGRSRLVRAPVRDRREN